MEETIRTIAEYVALATTALGIAKVAGASYLMYKDRKKEEPETGYSGKEIKKYEVK